MLPPPRDRLDALTAAARAVAPTGALGFSRVRADGRLLIHYSYIYGIGAFVLDAGDCPSDGTNADGQSPAWGAPVRRISMRGRTA